MTFVGVTTESRGAGHWDSHEKNFSMLKTFNLPNLDEIGCGSDRRPERAGPARDHAGRHHGRDGPHSRVNGKAGRDHWPQCGFALLFGGGVKEGFVLGASDKLGAYPTDRPVSPGDLVATMYHLLGVDSQMMLPDLTGRPIGIAHGGTPIMDIIA